MTWWQWVISIYFTLAVIILFAFSMAGAIGSLPFWRVITSAIIWPYILYLGLRDELGG